MSAMPDPRSTSFFAMPIVVSACARSSSSPSSRRHRERGLGEASPFVASRPRSLGCGPRRRGRVPPRPRPSRRREPPRARDAPGRGRARPRSQKTRARNDSASDARSVSPTASNASRAASSASCWRARRRTGGARRQARNRRSRALGVVRPERERVLVLRRCDRVAVEGERAVSGRARGAAECARTISSSSAT